MTQAHLFRQDFGDQSDGSTPAKKWDEDLTRHALDELFTLTGRYRSTKAYAELLRFTVKFRAYAPFNAMLVHIQKPGSRFVAPPSRWQAEYGRRIKPGALPLVILQPMGPVMFVFDVSDTEPVDEKAVGLPRGVIEPFEVRGGHIDGESGRTIENARRDGVAVHEQPQGSQLAGLIRSVPEGQRIVRKAGTPRGKPSVLPLRYELLLSANHSAEAKYATLVHELAHLYCGHLGTPNAQWWPDRRGLSQEVREFEAESVCYLVCRRAGIDNPSEQYLAGYGRENQETPGISLSCIMRSGGLIEQMGRMRLPPRKETEAL